MLTLESLNLDRPLSVFLAIGLAEKALPIWEAEYPEDMSPRKAIEAAKEWLKNPSDAATNAAADAANAASAYAASYAAAYAAYAAAYAPAAAYAALEADKKSFIHEVILENLDFILQYKIDNGQNFAQPELILNYLNEEQKQSFLFNLDSVA